MKLMEFLNVKNQLILDIDYCDKKIIEKLTQYNKKGVQENGLRYNLA